jgi:hypothetical protein
MYRFKSKAAADLLMMAPVGDQILGLIGREPSPQGIIEVGALPAAIEAREKAIAAAEMARQSGKGADDEGEGDERGAVRVGLAQRAWPLLEMMRRSLREQADIVWGV